MSCPKTIEENLIGKYLSTLSDKHLIFQRAAGVLMIVSLTERLVSHDYLYFWFSKMKMGLEKNDLVSKYLIIWNK